MSENLVRPMEQKYNKKILKEIVYLNLDKRRNKSLHWCRANSNIFELIDQILDNEKIISTLEICNSIEVAPIHVISKLFEGKISETNNIEKGVLGMFMKSLFQALGYVDFKEKYKKYSAIKTGWLFKYEE
jgi:hypothetical protein